MIDEPGIYTLSADEYHADPVSTPSLSWSIAKTMLSYSPLHAKLAHPRLNPDMVREDDARFEIGTAAHSMFLENDGSRIVFLAYDDWRTKAAKEARDTARALGQVPLLDKYEPILRTMVSVARKAIDDSELSGLLGAGKPEQTLVWKDGETWCRSRLDFLADDYSVVLDYKTATNASPAWFSKQVGAMSYDGQGSFYQRGVAAVTDKMPVFVLLAQEIDPPYACSLVGLSNAYVEIGLSKVDRALALWTDCLRRNVWPSYPSRIAYAEPPAWAVNEHIRAAAMESGDWTS